MNCIYEPLQKYPSTFVQHFRKIKPVLVLVLLKIIIYYLLFSKKKKKKTTKYNGRAPGLHPDYFCHFLPFILQKR